MLKLDDAERDLLRQAFALSTDDLGNEIFVGLTVEESEALVNYTRVSRARANGADVERPENRAYFLMLNEKHNIARLAVIGSELQKRDTNPILQ